ncbi:MULTISPECIES: flagellin [Nocardioides]|uniref:flagellin N-terminal helical domain-containing protein n=1 Tax=Nocardioides TaxID=1839 RepID=UPI00187AB2BF|nr:MULTISPECIES: flagellin [Nocardioides]MCM3514787.1 flagellin [Nocardioides sp. P86]
MSLRINTNTDAFNSYRNLSVTQGQMSKSLEKLSSGFRINRAADDAAGLAISEGLRAQTGGLKVAVRNAQDGISVVQTAEGALNEVHSILQRMRDLAVQGANDTNSADARTAIATEATQLQSELTRIADSTNFNGKNLLDGSAGTMSFQVGAGTGADSRIAVDFNSADVSAVATALGSVSKGTNNVNVSDITAGDVVTVTNGTTTYNLTTAAVPASLGELVDTLNADSTFTDNFSASVNGQGQLEVVSKAGGTVDVSSDGAGFDTTTATSAAIGFGSHTAAQSAIGVIDQQIKSISEARANLGAVQNRFEHTINNLNVAVENLSASESRIRDTDMAQEMMSFTRSQILSQAGTAMLAQANSAPQGVLSLLRG